MKGAAKSLLRLAEEQTEWLRMKLANGQSAWEVEIDARIKRYQEEHQRAITYKEAMDMMFIKEYLTQKGSERHKKPFSALDEELFKELDKTRDAFSEAVEEQEGIYFHQTKKWNGTGTPWPEDMQIIKLTRDMLRPDQTFDNEITICIDGIEVIRAYSSLIPTGNLRKNNLMSQSGDKSIKYYTKQLSAFFEIAGLEQVKRIPEDVMIEIANRIPNIEAIEQFLTNPGPKV
jgi:hypothetical protein